MPSLVGRGKVSSEIRIITTLILVLNIFKNVIADAIECDEREQVKKMS